MSKLIRTLLIGIAPIALLALSVQVYAQANDVDCNKCVDTSDIARHAVNSNKIAKQAVTTGKIAKQSVTSTKIAKDAVTSGKIKDGAVTVDKVAPELKAGIGTFCAPGKVVIGKDSNGNFECEPPGGIAATCDELLTSEMIYGRNATGFDLRARTYSTLHFLGCPSDACSPASFYCTYDEAAQTLEFGMSTGTLRALVDPGDVLGDTNPTASGGCCSSSNPNGICNGFDSNANGTGVNAAVALCDVLGYRHGSIVREEPSNTCPEIHATSETGLRWDSDYVSSLGYGAEYLCSGFK